MSKPIVYVEIKFISAFLSERVKPLNQIKNSYGLLFIEELLKKSYLFINISKSDIEKTLRNEMPECELYTINLINYIRELAKLSSSIIYSCFNEIDDLKQGILSNNESNSLPNFILLDVNKYKAEKIQEKIGIICFPRPDNSIYNESSIKVMVKPINSGVDIPIRELCSELFAHTIIIEDPYLLANYFGEKVDFIKRFISNILNSKFTNTPLYLILVISKPWRRRGQSVHEFNDQLEDYQNCINHINDDLEAEIGMLANISLKIHIIEKAAGTFHDRHVISNSFWVTCGYGFGLRYKSNTEWIYKPIGIYFTQMEDRINQILTGLQYDLRNELSSRFFKGT